MRLCNWQLTSTLIYVPPPRHRRRRPAKAPASEPAAQLLEMFAELVDARMESCVRMERLVRESGRGCAVC